MRKVYLRILLFFLMLITMTTGSAFSQESKDKLLLDDNPMQKGNWAVVFEAGTIFWGYNSNYNSPELENYNFLIKYHFDNKTAARLNFSLNGRSENYTDYISEYDSEGKNVILEFNANLQYFITNKYFAKPFVSFGPYYNINYNRTTNKNSNYENKSNNWSMGVVFTFGAELFVYKNIELIGEYIIKGSFNKYNYSSRDENDIIRENNISVWKVKANSSRFGVSFYF
jgi:hypothetical protein